MSNPHPDVPQPDVPYPDVAYPDVPNQDRAYPDIATPASEGRSRAPRRRGSVLRGALVALTVAAAGPALGWVWYQVAPRLAVVKVQGGFTYAETEPEQPVAADGWFAILGAVAGLAFAVLAWQVLRRHRGIAVLLGLSIGSLGAAALALWVGHRLGGSDFEHVRTAAAVGTRLDAPLGVRITDLEPKTLWPPWTTGVVAVQALVAAFVYTCFAGISPYADLRPEPPTEAGSVDDQFGPGRTGSSPSATGTAFT